MNSGKQIYVKDGLLLTEPKMAATMAEMTTRNFIVDAEYD